MNPRATRPVLAALALAATAALVSACGTSAPAAPTATTTVTHTASPPASQPGSGGASTAPVSATSSTPAAPACLTRYLHGAIADSDGAAGTVYANIVFKNLDNVACTMYGYPGVAMSEGLPIKLVGATARENPATARELVTLPPHGYAHAQFGVSEAGNFDPSTCHAVTVHWLQVIPPGQVAGLYIPYRSQTCLDKSIRLMTVSAVRPGKGSLNG